MSITKLTKSMVTGSSKLPSSIYKAVNKFERAVDVYTYRGGGHPGDIPIKEKEYEEAKKNLYSTIRHELWRASIL